MSQPVNIFSNDPRAQGLRLAQVQPPSEPSRFAIPGWTGAGGLFDPGSLEFQVGQLHVVLNHTYTAWADFFGGHFAWQSGVEQLRVNPRATSDLNAFYDRSGIAFGFAVDQKTGETIYTCESSDIIAHECGHAILDAQHPEYWDSLLPETAALHEAFSDIAAMLATLNDPQVRAAVLAEHGGNLRASNTVTRLAEQMASGFFNAGKAEAIAAPNALRDTYNSFRYRDPDRLPMRTPASQLSSESHNFSRIFSGAFYEILVGMYEHLRQTTPTAEDQTALAQATHDAGHLLAQSLILTPRGDATFRAIAMSMLNANQQIFNGAYFDVLRDAFVRRRIVRAYQADLFRPSRAKEPVHISSLTGLVDSSVGTPLALGVAEAQAGASLPLNLRESLRVLEKGFELVDELQSRAMGRVMHYAATREVELQDRALGVAHGVVVTMTDALAVLLDDKGRVLGSHRRTMDDTRQAQIHDHITKLIARNRVYEATEAEPASLELIRRRQPYYIVHDRDGKKRIRRAFIACGKEK